MAIFTVGFNPAIDRILDCPDFHIGGHQTVRQVARLAAGKAANVSRALALLSLDSIATGFVGADEIEFFHTELMSLGPGRILCRFVDVNGATRENISILDPNRMLETHLRDRGFEVTPAETEVLTKKLGHEVRAGDVVVFAGSLCGGVNYEYFSDLIDRCVRAGARVIVDTHGEALKAAVHNNLWLIKPNLAELRALVGQEIPDVAAAIRDAAQTLLPHVEQVLVSRGAAGAVLVTRHGAWAGAVAAKVPAIRTVGCGDHLLAGFVAELTAGRDAEPALRQALAVATARAVATDFSEFDLTVVQAFLEDVKITPI